MTEKTPSMKFCVGQIASKGEQGSQKTPEKSVKGQGCKQRQTEGQVEKCNIGG